MLCRRDFLFASLASAGCATSIKQLRAITPEEYEIFRLQWSGYECAAGDVLNFIEVETRALVRTAPSTEGNFYLSKERIDYAFKKNATDAPQDAIDSLFAANAKPSKIEADQFDFGCVRFVTSAEAKALSEQFVKSERGYRQRTVDRIEKFRSTGVLEPPPPYEFYDMRLRRFSRLGFNARRDLAIGYRSYFCGGLCALTELYLATKRDAKWTIAWEEAILIS